MALLASKHTYFQILELAGEGLNSHVYKALRTDASGTISQTVALKILKSKKEILFWRQEVESLLEVRSDFCVKVLGFEWVKDQPAVVLEWLEGVTLARLFETTEISQELAREILLQIQEGLVDLSLSGLCHGDLHMHNIFITREGRIKLIDFGRANASRYKEQGTPQIMAPEIRFQNSSPNLWSDLYSLGQLGKQLGVHCPTLLEGEPEKRDLLEGLQDPESRVRLSESVRRLVEKDLWLKEQKTVYENSRPSSKLSFPSLQYGLLFLLGFLCFLAPQVSPTNPSSPSCLLIVSTHRWHRLTLDGQNQGYAPLSLRLEKCGKGDAHSLHWENSSGSGDLTLKLAPGGILQLTDKDLKFP
jgi:serine/threonine protein kinase